MNFLDKTPSFKTRADVFSFFFEALDYRKKHRDESEKVALFVFDATQKNNLGTIYDQNIDILRNEFGALEAPGLPENNEDSDDFRERLWDRLQLMVGIEAFGSRQ